MEMNLHVIQTCFEELDHTRAAGIRDGQIMSRARYLRAQSRSCYHVMPCL
jgi:hypothetical protein